MTPQEGGEQLDQVTTGAGVFAAVGHDWVGEGGRLVARVSADGETWERPEVGPDQLARDGEEFGGVDALCHGPSGFLAAATVRHGNRIGLVLLRSADGRAWERLPIPPLAAPLRQQQARACVGTEDGYLLTGVEDGDALIDGWLWSAPDGRDWTRIEVDGLSGPDEQWINAMAVEGPLRLLAGGVEGEVAVWLSREGGPFERLELDQEVFGGDVGAHVSGAAIVDGHAVLVGGRGGGAAVWTADLAP